MFRKISVALRVLVLTLVFSCVLGTDVHADYLQESDNMELVSSVDVLQAEVIGFNRMSDTSTYSTFFDEASVSVVYSSTGMHIDICTSMNGVASVVGVKGIEIQKQNWYGGWTTVATSSGGESYNVTTSVCSINYKGAIEGETYRIIRTHYGNVDSYRELYAETGGFLCNIGYGG